MRDRLNRRWSAAEAEAFGKFHRNIRGDEMRRAAKVDANQHALVEALKRIGARCYFIGKPLDLLVGFRGRNILIEVKNPDGGNNRLTQEQEDFISTWNGELHICRTIDEAITAVVNAPSA